MLCFPAFLFTSQIYCISFFMTSCARVPAGHPPKTERTLIVVKPDGVQRRLVGRVIQRFEQRGFKMVGLKMLQVQNNIFSAPLRFSNNICDEGVRGSAVSPLPSAENEAILSRPGAIHDLGARGCHGECSLLSLLFKRLALWPVQRNVLTPSFLFWSRIYIHLYIDTL